MSRKLKPCPFCGVGVQNTDDSDKYPRLFYRGGYYVECECCGAYLVQTNKYKGPGWNTRPIEDALNARIAQLEAELATLKSENVNLSKKMTDYEIVFYRTLVYLLWRMRNVQLFQFCNRPN